MIKLFFMKKGGVFKMIQYVLRVIRSILLSLTRQIMITLL
jgi:hypothetical protein